MADVNPVIVRTLNYLRGVHLPTYVALRIMLNRVPTSTLDSVLNAIISQATIRKSSRILELKRFKSESDSGFVYRAYSVPSPTSALADSYAVSVLHTHNVVKRRSYVFSYRRPLDSAYPKNFEHFSIGYGERNAAIAKALEGGSMVAIVVDIRNFYPTVDFRSCIEELRRRVASSTDLSPRDAAVVMASAERAGAAVGNGLRVGPEMSHVLADMSLEALDEILVNEFGDRYFRYVDDIVVVVDRERASASRRAIGEALALSGHSVSEEKDAIVGRDEWSGYEAVAGRVVSDVSLALSALKFRSKLYLAKRPDEADLLKDAFREVGVYFPTDQLLDGSRQKSWRYRVTALFSDRWRVVAQYWGDTMADVVVAARDCRRLIVRDADQAIDSAMHAASSSVSRKWQIQAARLAINRALYFADDNLLRRIRDFSSEVPELAETSAVCSALLGDPSAVVKMPGPAVSAFTQVAAIRDVKFPDLRLVDRGDEGVLVDVAAHFALRAEGVEFEAQVLDPELSGLAAFASGARVEIGADKIGYGAEVAALGINSSHRERADAASTRFATSEEVVLDAMNLSTNYLT